jgi:hypothetical protein
MTDLVLEAGGRSSHSNGRVYDGIAVKWSKAS